MQSLKKFSREIVLGNSMGLHLRPCTKLHELIKGYSSKATLSKGEITVDLRNGVMEIVFLCAEQGDTLHLEVEGEDAEQVLDAIVHLFEVKFYEDEFTPPDQREAEEKQHTENEYDT